MGGWGKVGLWTAASAAFGIAAVALVAHHAGRPDFDIFWGAQHSAVPYDTAAVKAALEGLSPEGPRYFAYPPTFLALSAPLKLIGDLRLAYGLWVTISAFALMAATRSGFAPLMLLSPTVVFAGLAGQTTFLVAAALFAGLSNLGRPRFAGLLIGLALCIKPQLAIVAPILLLLTGSWRPLLVAGLVVLIVAAAATFGWGFGVWMAWLRCLPDFLAYNERHLSTRELVHLPTWLRAGLAAASFSLAWFAFKRAGVVEALFAGSVVTALLISPHAIKYEIAALAPVALAVAVRRDWRLAPAVGLLVLPPSAWSLALGMAAATPVDAPSWLRRRGSA